MTPHIDPETLALIEAYCNGTLESSDLARLEERLQADPAARHFYLRYVNVDASLREYGGNLANAWQANESGGAAATSTPPLRWRTLWLGLGIGAAAAILLVVLARGLFPPTSPSNNPEELLPGEVTDNGVAVLTRTIDVIWDEATPPRAGTAVPPSRLRIKSGIIQLEFYSGAQVTIEGPADFELISSARAICHAGKLRARVPPQARGFTVDSPKVELIDLGTEFGMQVESKGQTEVHVFGGKVELLDRASDPNRQELKAGAGLRFDDAGKSRTFAARPEDFVSPEEVEERAADDAELHYQRWRKLSQELRNDPRVLAYYAFEDEAMSGRTLRDHHAGADQRHGAIVGCSWVPGRWAKKGALEFKRPGDRIRLHVGAHPQSLSLVTWVRIDALDHRYNSILLTDAFSAGEPHWQIAGNGELIFGLRRNPRQATNYTSRKIFGPRMFGQWTQLALVYDASERKVTHYVNGVAVVEHPFRFDVPLHLGACEIGNWAVSGLGDRHPVRNLNGRMDEFILFQTPLAADEIRKLYDIGKPRS